MALVARSCLARQALGPSFRAQATRRSPAAAASLLRPPLAACVHAADTTPLRSLSTTGTGSELETGRVQAILEQYDSRLDEQQLKEALGKIAAGGGANTSAPPPPVVTPQT